MANKAILFCLVVCLALAQYTTWLDLQKQTARVPRSECVKQPITKKVVVPFQFPEEPPHSSYPPQVPWRTSSLLIAHKTCEFIILHLFDHLSVTFSQHDVLWIGIGIGSAEEATNKNKISLFISPIRKVPFFFSSLGAGSTPSSIWL